MSRGGTVQQKEEKRGRDDQMGSQERAEKRKEGPVRRSTEQAKGKNKCGVRISEVQVKQMAAIIGGKVRHYCNYEEEEKRRRNCYR